MSVEGSTKAVVTALGANLGIAVTKFVAFVLTGSSSMLAVPSVIHMRTMHLGPDELLVAAKIAVDLQDDAREVAEAINDAEARIRRAVPIAQLIYLEPDVLRTKG